MYILEIIDYPGESGSDVCLGSQWIVMRASCVSPILGLPRVQVEMKDRLITYRRYVCCNVHLVGIL